MRRFRPHPAALILVATALSGACGYVIGILVPRHVPTAEYASFAVIWSTLFFVVGAMGGLQQEFARATVAAEPGPGGRGGAGRTLVFALVVGTGVGSVLAATGPLWRPIVVPGTAAGGVAVAAIAVGVGCYILVAVAVGTLYGLRAWVPIAALLALDGVLRLVGVTAVLAAGGDGGWLAWAIVLPFPAALLLVIPFVAGRVRREAVVDASLGSLARHSAQLVVAAAATAALVSGVPLLLQLALPAVLPESLAPVLLSVTLTRAPIVIPLLALQSYLVVRFRDAGSGSAVRLALVVLGAGALLAVAVGLIGPAVLAGVFGDGYRIGQWALGLIVASSGSLAAMCVLAAALIARGRHTANTAGWVIAVAGTVLLLLVPGQTESRVGVALLGGSLLGLGAHLGVLATTRRRATGAPS